MGRRERSRERSRSRERDRDRTTKDKRRSRSRSRERKDTKKDRERYSNKNERRHEKHYEDYNDTENYEEETRCIVLRGLKTFTTEEQISDHIKVYGPVEQVRLARDKVSGESKGFAFVDFPSIQDAKQFMNYTNGTLTIDGNIIYLEFSKSHSSTVTIQSHKTNAQSPQEFKDWICPQCKATNFARRRQCYICQAPIPDNPATLTVAAEEAAPCSIIVIRGLDYATTEQTLWNVFSALASIKEIRLVRDKLTQASRGFAFVEFFNLEDAMQVMQHNNPMKIDGRTVKLAYTNRYGHKGSEPVEQAQWLAQQYFDRTYSWPQQPNAAPSSSSAAGAIKIPGVPQVDVMSIIKSKDLSQFAHDNTYGHYYHAPSGLYFYPNTKQYWDSINGVYYSLDPATQEYVEAAKQTNAPSSPPDATTKEDKKDKKDPKAKGATPKPTVTMTNKKMTQNLMKWNQKNKELHAEIPKPIVINIKQKLPSAPENPQPTTTTTTEGDSSAIAPSNVQLEEPQQQDTTSTTTSATAEDVHSTSSDAFPDIELDESQIVVGNICLLCKRQFNSLEVLSKHLTMSELHKQNVEIAKQQQLQRLKDAAARAEEEEETRRYEFTKRRHGDQHNSQGDLNEHNKGSKLLEKMGWKKGEGIGRQNVLTAPIEVAIRNDRAGLGMHSGENNPSYAINGADTYQDAVKKRARARFDTILETATDTSNKSRKTDGD